MKGKIIHIELKEGGTIPLTQPTIAIDGNHATVEFNEIARQGGEFIQRHVRREIDLSGDNAPIERI